MNFRKNSNYNFVTILATLLASVLLTILILSGINKLSVRGNFGENNIYTRIIGYSLPIFKSNGAEEKFESVDVSAYGGLLNLLGIGKGNHLNIVGKEIAYVTYTESKNNSAMRDPEGALNRFTLNYDQVYEEETQSQSNGNMNSAPAFSPELKKKMPSKPEVLIYHTHTCESYKPYGTNIADKDKNICAVGEELKSELEKYGINVLHDTTVHDTVTYNKSYERSRVTLDKYLKEYKDFKLIIDLHRDSVENKKAVTTNINGEDVARFAFVMTKKNPHADKNLKLAENIRNISNKYYPGNKENPSFNKGTFYYNYGRKFYNQDASNNSVLIEIGSHINTIQEAKASTKYLARIIAEQINGKNE